MYCTDHPKTECQVLLSHICNFSPLPKKELGKKHTQWHMVTHNHIVQLEPSKDTATPLDISIFDDPTLLQLQTGRREMTEVLGLDLHDDLHLDGLDGDSNACVASDLESVHEDDGLPDQGFDIEPASPERPGTPHRPHASPAVRHDRMVATDVTILEETLGSRSPDRTEAKVTGYKKVFYLEPDRWRKDCFLLEFQISRKVFWFHFSQFYGWRCGTCMPLQPTTNTRHQMFHYSLV